MRLGVLLDEAGPELAERREAIRLVHPAADHPRHLLGGRWDLLGMLGSGATATIYRAYNRELLAGAAIKVLDPKAQVDPDICLRFIREAIILRAVRHSNIPAFYELGTDAGCRYIVMELCPGKRASEYASTRTCLAAGAVTRIGQQLASALGALHAAGVIYRDLSTDNVLIDFDGTDPKVMLIDFSASLVGEDRFYARLDERWAPPPEARPRPSRDLKLEKRSYAAPEVRAGAPWSEASDVYALGLLLYQLLTGQVPFPFAEPSASSACDRRTCDRQGRRRRTRDVPVHVRAEGLDEAGALLGRLGAVAVEAACGPQDAVDGRGADGDDVVVEHHEGQSPVAFERVLVEVGDDHLAFPQLDPVIARDLAVVLVGLAVAAPPLVELGAGDAQPLHELDQRHLGLLVPRVDEVDDLGRARRGEPSGRSGLPSRFFYLDQLLGHLGDDLVLARQPGLQPLDLRLELLLAAGLGPLARFPEGQRAVLEQVPLPAVEDARLQFGALAPVGGDLSRFRVGDEVPDCDIMFSAEPYFRLGAPMRPGVNGISVLEPWDCSNCRSENAVRIDFAEGRVSRIEVIVPSAAELSSIDLFSFSFEKKEIFVAEVMRLYANVDESRVRSLSQTELVEAIVDEELGRAYLDLDDADEDD